MKVRNFEEFKKDNWYIYTGTVREELWNNQGNMDFALKHFPVKCILGYGNSASFEDMAGNAYSNFYRSWGWVDGFDNWIEIKNPRSTYLMERGEFYYDKNCNEVSEGCKGYHASGQPNYALTRPPLDKKKIYGEYISKFPSPLYNTEMVLVKPPFPIAYLSCCTGERVFVNKKRKFKKL